MAFKRGTGWVALLEQRLQQENITAKVVNASISGDTTSGGRSRLPALLAQHKPTHVIVELGGNDALRGLPLQMTRRQPHGHDTSRAARPAPGCCWWACKCRPTTAPTTPGGLPRCLPTWRVPQGGAGALFA
jgi:hypothetical protein